MLPPSRKTSDLRRQKPSQNNLFIENETVWIGTVERIRFRAENTGFSVLVVQPENDSPSVVVVGLLSGIHEGERVQFDGMWTDHPRFGKQFQAKTALPILPTTADGIEKFLASGTIKNIGPALAKRIIELFGERSFDVIENEPSRLLEVPGLGEKKIEQIIESWKQHGEIKDVFLFLQDFEIPLYLAEKIFHAYGPNAAQILRENPYRLASDIYGVGFRTADRIAQKLGISKEDPNRCEAGSLYILNRLAESEGHIFVPYPILMKEVSSLLDISPEIIDSSLGRLQKNGAIVIEKIEGPLIVNDREFDSAQEKNRRAIYSQSFHSAECEVSRRLATLIQSNWDEPRMEAALRGKGGISSTLKDRLSAMAQRAMEGGMATQDQAQAIEGALTKKVLIVTGGPGTGKTTIVDAVTKLYDQLGLTVILGAPTGRAAKRLADVTKHDASTIHRLLEFSWTSGGFLRDASNPLTTDAVIIDEASMVDIHLMANLLRAVPDTASFMLVGDVDQLPSVGPGNVLRDLIDSNVVPVVRLEKVFRQAKESFIVENAHRINRGEMPKEPKGADAKGLQDYYFIEENEPERCVDILIELCQERIQERFGLDPINDLQVITPMQRGSLGVQQLNAKLQEALNPAHGEPSISIGERDFRTGDKLIQIRNNYEKNVFNGDIGIIQAINNESITVAYDSGKVEYNKNSLDEVVHAYAVTVHKSQGSEYPAVIIPLHTQHYPMLQRNLVYTALTRAKKLAVFIGSKKALAIAIKNAKVRRRWSNLAERIQHFVDHSQPNAGSAQLPQATKELEDDVRYPEEKLPASSELVSNQASEDDNPPLAGELTYHPIID